MRRYLKRLLGAAAASLLIAQTPTTLADSHGSLPRLAAYNDQTSVSGLSSGAFMAAQFHIAYSDGLVGAGVVAGGPWNCAASHLGLPSLNAMSVCMNPCLNPLMPCTANLFPDTDRLIRLAESNQEKGNIDQLENLQDDRVYLFSGHSDRVVLTQVMDSTQAFYAKAGVQQDKILYNKSVDAGHAVITDQPADTPCALTESPFINNCGFEQTERMLEHIYGALKPAADSAQGTMLQFSQQEFYGEHPSGFDTTGFLYVPTQCEEKRCRIHVAFHGCEQSVNAVGKDFIEGTGYNRIADSNDLLILYPQIKATVIPENPMGCWDFWGYNNLPLGPYNYYKKDAPQMKAVAAMIERLSASR